jgi:hypothetical protein
MSFIKEVYFFKLSECMLCFTELLSSLYNCIYINMDVYDFNAISCIEGYFQI